ncbi:hypothetical protein Ahia01_000449900 [Argonauta hians]
MKDLKFPSVRTVLWDRASQGPAVNVDISSFRQFQICLSSKTLGVLHEHCSGLVENQVLILSGYIRSDNDGSRFSIVVDPVGVSSLSSETTEMSLQISVLVSKSNKSGYMPEDYNRAVKSVITRCGSKDPICLSSFFSVLGKFFVQSENGRTSRCIEFDMLTSAARFEAVPINPVTIMTTALAKNLASPMSLSRLQGKAKSGYVTMDHTRKLVLMLESDPKVSTLPLIGIWVSGVECVTQPYVWASCLRYVYNNSLNQRVCLPPHRFMLLLYCLRGNKVEFYECGLVNGKEKTHEIDTFCGSKIVDMASDFDEYGLDVDLSLLKYGIKKDRIDSVAVRVCDKSKSKPGSSCVNDEITPRTIPTPHQSKIPEARFSVPEVSLIFNDTSSHSSLQRKSRDNPPLAVPNNVLSPPQSNYNNAAAAPVCTRGFPSSVPLRNSSYPYSKVSGDGGSGRSKNPAQFCQPANNKPLLYSGAQPPSPPHPHHQPPHSLPPHHHHQNLTPDVNMYANNNPPASLQPVPHGNLLPASDYDRSMYPAPIHFQKKEIMQGLNSEQHPHFQYCSQNNAIPLPANSYTHPHSPPHLPPHPHHLPHPPQPVMNSMPDPSSYGPFPTSQPPCFTSRPVMCDSYHHQPQHHRMVNSQPLPPHNSVSAGAGVGAMSSYQQVALPPPPTLPSCPCLMAHAIPNSQSIPVPSATSYHHTNTSNVPCHPNRNENQNHAGITNPCHPTITNTTNPTTTTTTATTATGGRREKNINFAASLRLHSVDNHDYHHDNNNDDDDPYSRQQAPDGRLSLSRFKPGIDTSATGSCSNSNSASGHLYNSAAIIARRHEDGGCGGVDGGSSSGVCGGNYATEASSLSDEQNFRASKDSGLGGLGESHDSSLESDHQADSQLSRIQRDSIPPEVYRLLMQQSAELQELKAQIQQMKMEQSSLGGCGGGGVGGGGGVFNQSLNQCSSCSSVASVRSESSETKSSSEKRPPHHETNGSYTLATSEFSPRDFSTVAKCLSVNQKSPESFHSDLVLDLPSYQTSLSRWSDQPPGAKQQRDSVSSSNLISASMCAKTTPRSDGGGGEDFDEQAAADELPGPIKNKEYYDGLINYVKELLQQESPAAETEKSRQDKDFQTPDSVILSSNPDKASLISNSTSYLGSGFNSVDCTLLPKINYISMLLESDTETSMEINSMALKYLKDEQLTQMAKLRCQNAAATTAAKANNKNFLCQIMRYGLDSSSPDISKYGMSVNDLTFATRKYMEKHHLIEGSDSKNTSNYLSNYSHPGDSNSPMAPDSTENVAVFDRPKELRQHNIVQNKSNVRKPFKNIQEMYLPMSESTPMLKSFPKKQSPSQPHIFVPTSPLIPEGDPGSSSANERILDIAKLKQMPKLL